MAVTKGYLPVCIFQPDDKTDEQAHEAVRAFTLDETMAAYHKQVQRVMLCISDVHSVLPVSSIAQVVSMYISC